MNRSFLIIFVPAVFVAAMYLSLGIYPPRRVWIGVAVVTAGLAAWGIRTWLKRGGAGTEKAGAETPATAVPGGPQK